MHGLHEADGSGLSAFESAHTKADLPGYTGRKELTVKKPYRLYDVYDDHEFLGAFDNMEDVRKACRERDKETDGEWIPVLFYRASPTAKAIIFENWTY